ncbi:VOC family protein [soil metagenome]
MQTNPYLFFDGRCEEALDFYKRTVGAEVTMMMKYKDAPAEAKANMTPGSEDKVMHAALRIGENSVMASDGHCTGHPEFKGFALSLMTKEPDKADTLFKKLAEGGQVQVPMTKTFFAERFGMLADKFGVNWMVLGGSTG